MSDYVKLMGDIKDKYENDRKSLLEELKNKSMKQRKMTISETINQWVMEQWPHLESKCGCISCGYTIFDEVLDGSLTNYCVIKYSDFVNSGSNRVIVYCSKDDKYPFKNHFFHMVHKHDCVEIILWGFALDHDFQRFNRIKTIKVFISEPDFFDILNKEIAKYLLTEWKHNPCLK